MRSGCCWTAAAQRNSSTSIFEAKKKTPSSFLTFWVRMKFVNNRIDNDKKIYYTHTSTRGSWHVDPMAFVALQSESTVWVTRSTRFDF